VLSIDDLRSRARRLEELTRGLAREIAVVGDADDPLLYLERRAYLNAIADALAGVDAARVVLARAVQRIDRRDVP
jgi:hypothetical protein